MGFCANDEPPTDQKVTSDVTEGSSYPYGTPQIAPEDPFGNIAAATGPMAYANPLRFSNKYWDDETGLGYWGYRYLSPRLGRWLSRDPLEEKGGMNLYIVCVNSPISQYDALGMAAWFNHPEYRMVLPLPLRESTTSASPPIAGARVLVPSASACSCKVVNSPGTKMTVSIYYNSLMLGDLAHERRHVETYRSTCFEPTESYAQSLEGWYSPCDKARCFASTVQMFGDAFFWLAVAQVTLSEPYYPSHGTGMKYADAIDQFNRQVEMLRSKIAECKGL
jgi:RHS repeat-associated protein